MIQRAHARRSLAFALLSALTLVLAALAAALPIGSYTPRVIAKPVHMSPEEALQASRDLRATDFIGIHWGTYKLAREPYDEPPQRSAAEVARLEVDPARIWLPKPGETLNW